MPLFHNPRKKIEDDLQQLERLVGIWEQKIPKGTTVHCAISGIPALQHQAEKMHYHYSYDHSHFSHEQISRYHSCLQRTPEKYKVNFENIEERAREAKIRYDEEKKSID